MPEDEATDQISPEIEQTAARQAKDRTKAARWNLDIAVFSFAVLIIVIILLFQDVGIEIVAPVATLGLAMVWLAGWWQGKQLYQRFYDEELIKLDRESKEKIDGIIEETIEERVQKALRERWR
ncbi:hypothetical protein ACFLWW_01455 [Chloroflexota bacterium]